MDDIKAAIAQASEKVLSSDLIQRTIETQLKDTVQQIIQQQFSTRSDFGKALHEKVMNQMRVNLGQITFAEYNQVVLGLVQGAINNAVSDSAKDRFEAELEQMFGAPPKSIGLSQLIAKYMDDQVNEICEDIGPGDHMGLIISEISWNTASYLLVGLNPSNSVESVHNCEIVLCLSPVEGSDQTYKLYRVSGNVSSRSFMPTCYNQTAKLLYQMYCAGSHIVLDQGKEAAVYNTAYFDEE